MSAQHPITPPPELVQRLSNSPTHWLHQITNAYQAGADMELEACCKWLRSKDILEPAIDALRVARRPKPPSLKEQALADLDTIQTHDRGGYQIADLSNIRRALEALPNG